MNVDNDTGEILDGPVLSNESEPVVKRGRIRTSMGAYLDKLLDKFQRPDGSEIPDPTPLQPPLGYRRQPTMVEHIRMMVQSEQLRVAALEAGNETFEEADDFDVPDEFEPISAYEFEEIFEPLRSAEPGVTPPREGSPPADGPAAPPASAAAPAASSSDST